MAWGVPVMTLQEAPGTALSVARLCCVNQEAPNPPGLFSEFRSELWSAPCPGDRFVFNPAFQAIHCSCGSPAGTQLA